MEHVHCGLTIAMAAALLLWGCSEQALQSDDDYGADDDDFADDDAGDDDGSDDDAGDDDGSDDDTGDDDTSCDDDDDSAAPPEDVCDEVPLEPTTLYMSADDSNSMAGPPLARQWIGEHTPITAAMRPYEFLNYYRFYYPPAPLGHVSIVPQARMGEGDEVTMLVGVVAPTGEDIGRRPRSLTLSIDSSGSMGGQPWTNTVEAVYQIAHNLVAGDKISMVSWATSATVLLQEHDVSGPDDPVILSTIDAVNPGGSTDLHTGLVEAYAQAQAMYAEDRLNRVILFSDGGANAGVTDKDLIATHADDALTEGIYLCGVGTDGTADGYNEDLMNTITDEGKGAYVYLDSAAEAERMFGDAERFTTVMEIAAMDVQLSVTLPAGYVLQEFHGEEVSEDPSEVEPQNLAPSDAMLYHFVLVDCTPQAHDGSETFEFAVTWVDPVTRIPMTDTIDASLAEMVNISHHQILKADAIVAYSEVLTEVWNLPVNDRLAYVDDVIGLIEDAHFQTGDAELQEILDLLAVFRTNF